MITYELDLDPDGLYDYELIRREHNGWIELDDFSLLTIDGREPTEAERKEGEAYFGRTLHQRMGAIMELLQKDSEQCRTY